MELDGVTVEKQKIKIEFFDDHIMTMAEFVSGKIPVLMTGFSQGLAYYRTNNDIVMISNPVWGVSLLVTNDRALTNLAAFEGKTILVPFAKSPLDVQLKSILKKSGMLDKIQVDYSPVQQQIPLLLSGKVAGISIPEPLASKLIYERKSYKVFSFAEEWATLNGNEPRTPQVSIFVKKEFAARNKIFFKALNKLLVKKIKFVIDNNEEVADKFTGFFSLDPVILKSSLKNVIFEIPDVKTEKKLCRDYQKTIEDEEEINDGFFFEY
jgi:ABC-type nitrate/sulfonate/bicarbonate transport system substrate-binding protein